MDLSIEDFKKILTSDVDSRKYIEDVAWGGVPKCPFCNCLKIYTLNTKQRGQLYKCAACLKKFSVFVGSTFQKCKLSASQLLLSFYLFAKHGGDILTIELSALLEARDDTAFFLKCRLTSVFAEISMLRSSPIPSINAAIKVAFSSNTCEARPLKRDELQNRYHLGWIGDLSDKATYDKLTLYAKTRMFYCKWIYFDFAHPREIVNEAFLFMYDNNIKTNDGTEIAKLINRTINRLWYNYQKAHPLVIESLRDRQKEWKRDGRRRLKDWYLIELEISSKRTRSLGLTREEIKQDMIFIEETRIALKNKRERRGEIDTSDFISHFL